jgi:hypothetical protein
MQTHNSFPDIPKEKFVFTQLDQDISDSSLETKPIGYFKDALLRLRRNKVKSFLFCKNPSDDWYVTSA